MIDEWYGQMSRQHVNVTVHCKKYPYIHGYFAAIFGGSMYIAVWARALLFRRFTDTNVYGAIPLKYGKLATKFPWIYGYFLKCTTCISVCFNYF